MSSKGNTTESDDVDLGGLIRTLWQGKLTIILTCCVTLFFGVFSIANTFTTFQADALLQLESRGGQLALPAAMQGLVDDAPESTTEIEVIRSRLILGRAVAELNLDWRVNQRLAPVIGVMLARYSLPVPNIGFLSAYARRGESAELSLLSVPPGWIGRTIEMTVLEQGYELLLPNGETVQGRVGETYLRDDLGFAINVAEINAPAGRVYDIQQIDERLAMSTMRQSLSVSERGRNSGILELRFSGTNRAENVRILNAIAQAYVRPQRRRSAEQP